MTLRATLNQLAAEFATSVLHAIRAASLEEILSETTGTRAERPRAMNAAPAARARGRKSGGRLGRRSATDIQGVVDQIVALLDKHPKGLRAEEIRSKLGLIAKELPRPIAEALAKRRISKQGQKRATTYFSRGAGAAKAAGKRGGKTSKKGGKGAFAASASTSNGASH